MKFVLKLCEERASIIQMILEILSDYSENIRILRPREVNKDLIILHYETVSVVLLMISGNNESNLTHCEKKCQHIDVFT